MEKVKVYLLRMDIYPSPSKNHDNQAVLGEENKPFLEQL
jgi:hypothetical protein